MFSGKSDLSQMNSCKTTIQVSSWLSKVLSAIKQKRAGKQSPDQEVEALMKLCLSENTSVSLIALQVLVKTAEDDLLPLSQVRTVLLSMLPNAEGCRFAAVVDGITSLMLVEVRKQSRKEKYTCPYGLQHPEHPFIAVLNAKKDHGQEIPIKVKEIFNHQDKDISSASTEFLRPVFLYSVKNMEKIPSVRTLWSLLVAQSFKSEQGSALFLDCLMWMSCEKATLTTNTLLCDTLEAMMPKKKHENTAHVVLLLAGSLANQLKLGLDPRTSLSLIQRVLQNEQCAEVLPQGALLLICIDLLEDISPTHLEDLLRVVKHLVFKGRAKGFLLHHMLLDSLILRSDEEILMSSAAKKDITLLKEHIEKLKNDMRIEDIENKYGKYAEFPDKTMGYYLDMEEFRRMAEVNFLEQNFKTISYPIELLKAIKIPALVNFASKAFRGMLLAHQEIPLENWASVMQNLSSILSADEETSIKFLATFRLEMKRIKDRRLKLELLRGVVECGHFRTNIQTILSLIRSFTEESGYLSSDILKLYLRLWQIDPRTYQYLYDHLAQARGKSDKELNMARAEAIKTICEKSPTQHGTDLVSHLSDVLNQCSSPSDDGTVICIVLETIILLCDSKTVSIVAIWKALGFVFRYEKRPNVIRTLCQFFGELPKYSSSSPEYDNMAKEIYERLWGIALNKNVKEVRESAFKALAMFPLETISLKQIPEKFRRSIKVPKSKLGPDVDVLDTLTYIPGECWLEMMLQIDGDGGNFAGDFIAQYIRTEIKEYRGGVYNVPAGKGEPENLSYLPPKSILRPIVLFVHQQAQNTDHGIIDDVRLIQCLRILAQDFPKPIPPVNWSCLHEIFHRCIEIRKYCVAVAINQSIISGTAKRFLCNYLEAFEPDTPDAREELLAAFDKLPKILDTVDPPLAKKYTERCLRHILNEDSTLQQRIRSVIPSLNEGQLSFLGEVLIETCPAIKAYDKLLRPLEPKHINFGVSFAAKQSKEAQRHICCRLAGDHKSIKLLDPILKHISDPSSKFDSAIQWQDYDDLLGKLLDVYSEFCDDSQNAVKWCLQILADMQFSMNGHEDDFYKYCWIFTQAVVHISRYFGVSSNIKDMDGFPQGLTLLMEQDNWKEHASQIYDFIIEFIQMPNLRDDIAKSFKRALVLSKDLPHFQQKSTWAKSMMIIKH